MLLRDKSDGSMWATNDTVLTTEEAKAADITASFVTLTAMDSGTERLYIWPYFADLAFEVLDPDYKMDEPEAPTLFPEIEAADLMTARTLAEEVGKQAGVARLAAVGASPIVLLEDEKPPIHKTGVPGDSYFHALENMMTIDVTPISKEVSNQDIKHDRIVSECMGKSESEIVDILAAEYGWDYTLLEELADKKQITRYQAQEMPKQIKTKREENT